MIEGAVRLGGGGKYGSHCANRCKIHGSNKYIAVDKDNRFRPLEYLRQRRSGTTEDVLLVKDLWCFREPVSALAFPGSDFLKGDALLRSPLLCVRIFYHISLGHDQQ